MLKETLATKNTQPNQDIKTKRLVLKPLAPTKENAQMLFEIIQVNKEHLAPTLPLLPQKIDTLQKALTYIEEQYHVHTTGNLSYYIFHEGILCGFIGTKSYDYSDKTELTYWLDKSAQGKGFMNEVLSQIELEHFKTTTNTLVGVVLKDARRSAALLDKNGYQLKNIAYIKTKAMYDAQMMQIEDAPKKNILPMGTVKSKGRS